MIQNAADKRKWLNILGAALLFAAVVEQMFISTTKGWDMFLHNVYVYGIAAQFALIVFCLFTVKNNSFALKTMITFFVWFLISRPLLGDMDLRESILLLVPAALNISIMCYAASLAEKQRRILLYVLAAAMCIFYCGVCLGVLYVAITRTRTFLPFYIEIIMKEEGGLHYVDLRASHRNLTAQWYCLCFCLAAILAYLSKKKLVKAFWGVTMVVFYATVAISLSRISMLALALSMGMMAAIILIKKFPNKKITVHVALALVAVIVVTPVVYKSYNLVGTAIEKISLAVTPIVETTDDANDNTSDVEDDVLVPEQVTEGAPKKVTISEDDSMFTETRDKENTMMLGGRVLVWRSIARVIRYEPWRLRYGSLTDDYVSTINTVISQTDPSAVVPNTHNFFIETLMMTGLPGFILVCVFALLLVVRMIKVFFAPNADTFAKLLTVPLTAALLKSMGEATLIWHDRVYNDITNYIFFLVAGLFLAYSYELFPEKRISFKKNKN